MLKRYILYFKGKKSNNAREKHQPALTKDKQHIYFINQTLLTLKGTMQCVIWVKQIRCPPGLKYQIG